MATHEKRTLIRFSVLPLKNNKLSTKKFAIVHSKFGKL